MPYSNHQSEIAFLAKLVDESSDAIFSRGLDCKIITWNKGAEKLFGYSKAEAIGNTATGLGIIKLSRQEINNLIEDISNKGCWQSEIPFYNKEDKEFHGSVTGNLIKNEKDDIISFYFIIKDISNQKLQHSILIKENEALELQVLSRTKELETSRNLYWNIFQNSPMSIWVFDIETLKFLEVNKFAFYEYGYSRDEFLSMTMKDIRSETYLKQFLESIDSIRANGTNYNTGITKHKRKDGVEFDVEFTSHSLIYKGRKARMVLSKDISRKLSSELAIESSEKKFRTLIETGHDVVTLFDKDFTIIYRSPSSTRVVGWTDEDVMGKKGSTNVHPDDVAHIQSLIRKIFETPGEYFEISARLKHKHGHYIWVEGLMINLLEDKNINAIVYNFRDVTEKKISEEKLAANEQRFRALIENGNDVVSIFDKDLKVIYRSPSATKILGWTDDDIMGNKATNHIFPDDRQYASEVIQEIMKTPAVLCNVTFRMFHKSGEVKWLEGVIINLLEDKNVNAIVFNFMDITEKKIVEDELKARESQFRNLIARISDAFLALDNDFKITYANTITEKLFHSKPGLLIGKTITDKFNSKTDSHIYNAISEVSRLKKSKRIDCYSEVLGKWISGTIYSSDTGITIFFRDNSDRKKLELELQEQQHQEQVKLISAALDAQERERNAIGLELHDNVNQILVGTIMILSLLRKNPEKTGLVDESINHIKQAIQENRKIAHILVSPDLVTKNFSEQIIHLCDEMLHTAGILTEAQIDEDALLLLKQEQQVTLYRIVQEQFTNIIKYAEATKVVITLLVTDCKFFRMRIADNGKGIPEMSIFKGIGFRNINSRLSVYNGTMKIETNPGKGFALEVEIPV